MICQRLQEYVFESGNRPRSPDTRSTARSMVYIKTASPEKGEMPWSKRKINVEVYKSWLNYECEKRRRGRKDSHMFYSDVNKES